MQNEIVSRDSWLQSRAALLAEEKAHTRERERLAKSRQQLPWVKLDKHYTFIGPGRRPQAGEAFQLRKAPIEAVLGF